jgi:hypothetical protein
MVDLTEIKESNTTEKIDILYKRQRYRGTIDGI